MIIFSGHARDIITVDRNIMAIETCNCIRQGVFATQAYFALAGIKADNTL